VNMSVCTCLHGRIHSTSETHLPLEQDIYTMHTLWYREVLCMLMFVCVSVIMCMYVCMYDYIVVHMNLGSLWHVCQSIHTYIHIHGT
jgi:hypothetical protein